MTVILARLKMPGNRWMKVDTAFADEHNFPNQSTGNHAVEILYNTIFASKPTCGTQFKLKRTPEVVRDKMPQSKGQRDWKQIMAETPDSQRYCFEVRQAPQYVEVLPILENEWGYDVTRSLR